MDRRALSLQVRPSDTREVAAARPTFVLAAHLSRTESSLQEVEAVEVLLRQAERADKWAATERVRAPHLLQCRELVELRALGAQGELGLQEPAGLIVSHREGAASMALSEPVVLAAMELIQDWTPVLVVVVEAAAITAAVVAAVPAKGTSPPVLVAAVRVTPTPP